MGGNDTRWHVLMAAVLVVMCVFLVVRAHDEDRWSLWAFGDATTIMTIRHWVRDGVLHHYGLELNKGYSRFTQHFDRPELRQHAHGNPATGVPGVGPDVYYTHYPSGYILPYYLLARLGLERTFWLRLPAIAASIAAIALLYTLFRRIGSAPIAFLACLFYLCSRMFIGYADSLVEHGPDDLLKFVFMHLALSGVRHARTQPKRGHSADIALWVTALALYALSWDSVLFVLVWLVGLDVIERKRLRPLRYAAVASAFVVGFAIQLSQNASYLGLRKALTDLYVRYGQIGSLYAREQGSSFAAEIVSATWSLFAKMVGLENWPWESIPTPFILTLVGVILVFLLVYRKAGTADMPEGFPSRGMLVLLFLCGCAFPVVLRKAAQMTYEGRQMAPFTGLLVAAATVYSLTAVRRHGARVVSAPSRHALPFAASCVLLATTLFLWTTNIHGGYTALNFAMPADTRLLTLGDGYEDTTDYSRQELELARHLGNRFRGRGDVVIFALNCMPYNSCDDLGRYSEVEPAFECYAWAPVLSFGFPNLLVEDLRALRNVVPGPLQPFVVTRTEDEKQEVLAFLERGEAEVRTVAEVLAQSATPLGAIRRLLAAIDRNPRYDTAHSNLGTATAHTEFGDRLYEHGELTRAAEHYEKALTLDPQFRSAHTGFGKVLEKQGRKDEAISHFRQALSLDPASYDAHSHLGCILAEREQFEEALRHFAEALRLRPTDAETCCDYGNALMGLGKHRAALKYFLRAVRMAPTGHSGHADSGRALMAMQRHDEAIASFSRALEADPANASAHCDWGNALAELGQHEQALDHFRMAAELNPEGTFVHCDWGNALADLGRHEEAIEHFTKALTLEPELAAAHCSWGNVLAAGGRHAPAAEHYRAAIEIDPRFQEAWMELGNSLTALGNADEAATAYAAAKKLAGGEELD